MEMKIWSSILHQNLTTLTGMRNLHIFNHHPFWQRKDNHEFLPAIESAYPLVILGDSVTTDHISPAGSFRILRQQVNI